MDFGKNINQFIIFDLIWHLKETKSFQQQKISQNIIYLTFNAGRRQTAISLPAAAATIEKS
jgi:hypothetical protein